MSLFQKNYKNWEFLTIMQFFSLYVGFHDRGLSPEVLAKFLKLKVFYIRSSVWSWYDNEYQIINGLRKVDNLKNKESNNDRLMIILKKLKVN